MFLETKYYIVQKIDGDYAILKRTDTEDDTILVARFLLPMEIDEGSNLIWENLEYKMQ